MIGQTGIKATIKELVDNNKFPRFSILVGPAGSGKKLLCKYIATQVGAVENLYGITVDEIRTLISAAYKVEMPILYVLADADRMSSAAKNALLKVTEEPPTNAYFVLTLTDINNTLGTIRSRGTVFHMNPYTVQELIEYARNSVDDELDEEDINIITEICETPGEVDTLLGMGTKQFYGYVEKVVDNIAVVSGSNSFKIAAKIKFKDTDTDKYDLRLFWKSFMSICSTRLLTDPMRYAVGISITSKYLQDLRTVSINKASTFDMWLLEVRKAWM